MDRAIWARSASSGFPSIGSGRTSTPAARLPRVTDRYASANGIGIHLADHRGGEPPIVLLPGITANLHNFDG